MKVTRDHLTLLAAKALENAEALIADAELLFDNGRWAGTVFLCHAAGEEFGKAVECLSAAMDHARGVPDFAKFRKRFLSHRLKTTAIRFFEAMVTPDEDNNFMREIKGLGEEVPVMLAGRNISLYSDIFSDGTVFAPNDVISEKVAGDALGWAKGRLAMARTRSRSSLRVTY
jgi:AbiV family abortive infection protein